MEKNLYSLFELLDKDDIEKALGCINKYEALKDAFDNVDFDALNKLLQGWV